MVRPVAAHLNRGDHHLTFASRLVEKRGGFHEPGGDVPRAMRMVPAWLARRYPEIPSVLIRHRFVRAG